MAANEPTWSLGKSKVFTSSGVTVTDGDDKWGLGKSILYHEYVAGASGWTGTINDVTNPSYVNGIAVADIDNINGV